MVKKTDIFLLFSLLLILFICISVVSASDTNVDDMTNINHDDENLILNDANSVVLSNVKADVVSNGNSMSFSDLKAKMKASSTVTLTSDVIYNPKVDSGSIALTSSVTINGNGHTIDAKSKTRIFTVPSGKKLTLNNLNIKNGYMSGDSGGVILNSGNIKINNCNFTNCKVVGSKSNGGAIAGAGGGTISNCNFIKCSAGFRGGSIMSNKITIKKCTFTDNKAGFGGAIGGTPYLYNSIFKNCYATKSDNYDGGGAVSGDLPRVEGCTFINCKATKAYGGALRGTTKAYNCIFINCVSKQGGAIRGKGVTSGCTFTNCVATKDMGGAIFTEKATITKSTFNGCSASKSNGGAIYAGNNVKITNCKFNNCKALKASGGAIYGVGVVSKCTFQGNRAKLGGAVGCYLLTVKSSTFISNKASKGGAAHDLKTMSSCSFKKNSASSGGAIYDVRTATSCKFEDNSANSGAVSYSDTVSLIKKATVNNKIKLKQGLFFNKRYTMTIANSKIVNKAKFTKYLIHNTGRVLFTKNKLQSTPKASGSKLCGPKKVA